MPQTRRRLFIIATRNLDREFVLRLDDLEGCKKTKVLKDILEDCEDEDSRFSRQLLKYYEPKDIIGKRLRDKRGGDNNIHSWDFHYKGEVSKEEVDVLTAIMSNCRLKGFAEIKEDGSRKEQSPLTVTQLSKVLPYDVETIERLLASLTVKNYISRRTVKVYDDEVSAYRMRSGDLSFPISYFPNPNGVTCTMTATDLPHTGTVTTTGIRHFTVREGLRLFGYPESFTLDKVSKAKAFDLLGNSVCVPCIKYLAVKILNALL